MPSRTPKKYSLDSATLRLPSGSVAKRGVVSSSSYFDNSLSSRWPEVDGESVYSTPRASVDHNNPFAAKSPVGALTGNNTPLGHISESHESKSSPRMETTPEDMTPVRSKDKRNSLSAMQATVQAMIEDAVGRAEKKSTAMASANRPFSWVMQVLKMLWTFLVVLVRLVGGVLTGMLIAMAILAAVWILQPDNFLVVSVSSEVKQLLRTYDLPGADFAWR